MPEAVGTREGMISLGRRPSSPEPARLAGRHRLRRMPRGRGRRRPDILAAIALGGSLGACARAGLGVAFPEHAHRFPWTTFAVNLSGSLVLGVVLVLVLERSRPTQYLRPFLATGFIGAYTTFSTFVVGVDQLVRAGEVGMAAAYLLGSLGGGLAAAWLGVAAGRLLPHPLHDRRHNR